MIDPDSIDAMVKAGASAEVIAALYRVEVEKAAKAAAEKREKAAERQRQSRARRASSQSVTLGHSDNPPVTVTLPETKVSPTPPSKTQPTDIPPSPPTGAQTPTRPKAKPLRPLPEDWAPSPEQRARWKARGATDALLDSSAEDMRTWANGKGVTRADWAATFDGFVKRDLAEGGRPRPAGGRGPPRAEPRNPFLEALERIPDDDSPSSSSNDPADLRAPRDLGPPRMAAQRLRAEEWEDAAVARQGANRN